MKEAHPGLSHFPHLTDFVLVDSSCSIVASEAMAINYTFAYIPGFFAQDAHDADSNAIGAVSEMRRTGCVTD